jgi:hypothetical protein
MDIMAVSKARRKEIKSLYSYSLYDMDFKSVANDDWLNACYITVSSLEDGVDRDDSLIYQANKAALEVENQEDYKIHYGSRSIYLPLYGPGGFDKTMEYINFLEGYPLLDDALYFQLQRASFVENFYDDNAFRLTPIIRNRLDCLNSGGLIDGCDISIDACLEKSHIASLALKSEFIFLEDHASVTACTKFVNSLNTIDILTCFLIDWDLPPCLESLVPKHINAFKSHLLYHAGIGSIYYKNPDDDDADEVMRNLFYNLLCYAMLTKLDPSLNVWSDSADMVAHWLDDNIDLLAQCGSSVMKDDCELLQTTPSPYIQFSLL